MSISAQSLSNFCNVAAGIGVAATATADAGVVAGMFQAVFGGKGILAGVREEKRPTAEAALKDLQREVEANWRDWAAHGDGDEGAVESAVAAFNEYFKAPPNHAAPTSAEVVAFRERERNAAPEKLAELMVARAAHRAPDLYADCPDNHLPRQLFHRVATGAFRRLLETDAYRQSLLIPMLDHLTGAVREEGAATRDEVRAEGAASAERDAAMHDMLRQLVDRDEETTAAHELICLLISGEGFTMPPAVAREIAASVYSRASKFKAIDTVSFLRKKDMEYINLQTQLRRIDKFNTQVSGLRCHAAEHLEAGAFDDARAVLLEAKRVDRAAREAMEEEARQFRYSEAEIENELAELAELRLDYLEAADHWAEAADVLPLEDKAQRWIYEGRRAAVLQSYGTAFGASDALEASIAAYINRVRPLSPRAERPLAWALTQNNLGVALQTLGAREVGTKRLEEAIDAFKAALEERTRGRSPLDWATTQNNLGNALAALGIRERVTSRLKEAVDAYKAALEERTRDRAPLAWAQTQNNLGIALKMLSDRETGTARLEEAVGAYTAALEEFNRSQVPLDWAMTQNNLGNAVRALGEREAGTSRLKQAVNAYLAALEERTRDSMPFDWAMTNGNLGLAYMSLAERGCPTIDEAIACLTDALQVFHKAEAEYDITTCTASLNEALALRDQLNNTAS